MTTSLEAELYKAAVLTFEELSFMLPLCGPDQAQSAGQAAAVATVRFSGPLSGRLVLGASDELLPAMTANILGDDNIADARLQCDALGEVANVICGNLLPAIGNVHEVYRIEAPQLQGKTPHVADEGAPSAEVCLVLEEGWARVGLYLERG